ncbi:hypothetical protein [Streptomyces scopuliridis]|uniref:hypothetical protein n=1 Tax=Streptomyces scopuliridis TaxID=452529 RepID=UPI0036C86B2B
MYVEDTAAYTALQERARELSAFVITHRFRGEVAAAEHAEARSELIHATQPARPSPRQPSEKRTGPREQHTV